MGKFTVRFPPPAKDRHLIAVIAGLIATSPAPERTSARRAAARSPGDRRLRLPGSAPAASAACAPAPATPRHGGQATVEHGLSSTGPVSGPRGRVYTWRHAPAAHLAPPAKAPVAQLDRVPGFEPGCRGFESLRARQLHDAGGVPPAGGTPPTLRSALRAASGDGETVHPQGLLPVRGGRGGPRGPARRDVHDRPAVDHDVANARDDAGAGGGPAGLAHRREGARPAGRERNARRRTTGRHAGRPPPRPRSSIGRWPRPGSPGTRPGTGW